jgi:hypothetical protein
MRFIGCCGGATGGGCTPGDGRSTLANTIRNPILALWKFGGA